MKSPRHNGRADDRFLDFVSPDGRLSERSVLHRYFAPESAVAPIGEVKVYVESEEEEEEEEGLDTLDFRARW